MWPNNLQLVRVTSVFHVNNSHRLHPSSICLSLKSAILGGHSTRPPILTTPLLLPDRGFSWSLPWLQTCRDVQRGLWDAHTFGPPGSLDLTSRHLSTQYTACLQKVQLVNWWYGVKVVHYCVRRCLEKKQIYTPRELQWPVQTSLHKWLTVHLVSSARVLLKHAIHSE